MAEELQRFKDRLSALKADRQPHEAHWRDCFDYSLPYLGQGLSGTTALSAGEIAQQRAKLLNGTAGEAMGTSADGFMGGMTPANTVWFGLQVGQDSDEEKAWLADAAHTIWENLHASNFDAEAYDAVLYLLGAGWFVLYVDEDDAGGYYCENWPLSQCYVASSRPGGKVDTIYRDYATTAGALADKHGKEKLSPRVRMLLDAGKADEMVQMCWAIEPRRDYLPGSQISTKLPWASIKFEVATGHRVSESGYHEFPCVVPRYRRIPGTAYGMGPMSDALPDAKSANEVERWELAAAETAIAPPLVVTDDGVLNARTIKLGPRKVIVANNVNDVKPLITGARVDFAQMMVEKLELKVRKALMADLFDKVLNDPTMTATQVHAILGMIRQRMGPRFGRLQAEWLQPLVERCYGIALRRGVLGQPPQSLLQRNYAIKYLSPLARAQAMEEVNAIEAHEGSLIAKAQAAPEVMDTYDWEQGARYAAERRGVPSDLVPDAKAVAAKREARRRQQAQQQQQQAAAAADAGAAAVIAEQVAAA